MVLNCIHRAKEDLSTIFTEWVAMVDSVRSQLQEGTVVDVQSIWPAPSA
jgi:hypothetical protein